MAREAEDRGLIILLFWQVPWGTVSPAFSLLILGFRVGNCLRDGFRDGDGSVNGDFIFADLMAGASTAL